jgi:hypothetical protein
MVRRRKSHFKAVPGNAGLLFKIQNLIVDEGVREAMIKDLILIEAALAADRIVISLDESVRGHFARASHSIDELKNIVWVNPEKQRDRPLWWLQQGAASEKSRWLQNFDFR